MYNVFLLNDNPIFINDTVKSDSFSSVLKFYLLAIVTDFKLFVRPDVEVIAFVVHFANDSFKIKILLNSS